MEDDILFELGFDLAREGYRPGSSMPGNEASVFVYAARYAGNRNTGAALQVVNEILRNWDRFDLATKKQLQREAKEYHTNIEDWERIIDK